MFVQNFVSQTSVKALNLAVLRWLSGINEMQC